MIRLVQWEPGNVRNMRWVNINLTTPRPITAFSSWNHWLARNLPYFYWGLWEADGDSLEPFVRNRQRTYFGSAPPEQRAWRYMASTGDLEFVEHATWTGGGPPTIEVVATLYNARQGRRGALLPNGQPAGSTGDGSTGSVNTSNFFYRPGPLRWGAADVSWWDTVYAIPRRY